MEGGGGVFVVFFPPPNNSLANMSVCRPTNLIRDRNPELKPSAQNCPSYLLQLLLSEKCSDADRKTLVIFIDLFVFALHWVTVDFGGRGFWQCQSVRSKTKYKKVTESRVCSDVKPKKKYIYIYKSEEDRWSQQTQRCDSPVHRTTELSIPHCVHTDRANSGAQAACCSCD